jgi:hypothetical protein
MSRLKQITIVSLLFFSSSFVYAHVSSVDALVPGIVKCPDTKFPDGTDRYRWAPYGELCEKGRETWRLLRAATLRAERQALAAAAASAQPPSPPKNKPIVCVVDVDQHTRVDYRSPQVFPPGTLVVLEGDRGEDWGSVVICRAESDLTPELEILRKFNDADTLQRELTVARGIKMFAQLLLMKTASNRNIAMDQMAFDSCRVQLDERKVTIYYQGDRKVQFRELVRELYKKWHVFVWLHNLAHNVK